MKAFRALDRNMSMLSMHIFDYVYIYIYWYWNHV